MLESICIKSTIKNLGELRQFAHSYLKEMKPGRQATVIALSGDLGSGKTAFVKEAAKYFDIKDDVTSPTFVLMKYYRLQTTGYKLFVHIDAYRLEKESELLKLGWAELIADPGNIIFIEWPENVKGIVPADSKRLRFAFVDENTREIEH